MHKTAVCVLILEHLRLRKGEKQMMREHRLILFNIYKTERNRTKTGMSISKTRQKLVDVARELFAQKGIDATTMNDIAQASSKGRRTLYTYFRSKEEVYYAVIEGELERLSEKLDEVAAMPIDSREKIIILIYTHLEMIRETVARNGSLRAEFFRNIWMVEKVRKKLDIEAIRIIRRVLQEGQDSGAFHVENVEFMSEIVHYAVKGLEVPYIYDRLGESLSKEARRATVEKVVFRALGVIPDNE